MTQRYATPRHYAHPGRIPACATELANGELPAYDPIAACDAALECRSWIDARPHLDKVAEGVERQRLEARYQAVKASWGEEDRWAVV